MDNHDLLAVVRVSWLYSLMCHAVLFSVLSMEYLTAMQKNASWEGSCREYVADEVEIIMEKKSGKVEYSDDEVEAILGIGAAERSVILNEVRDTIRECPLLVTGLALALGILIGVGLSQGRKRSV